MLFFHYYFYYYSNAWAQHISNGGDWFLQNGIVHKFQIIFPSQASRMGNSIEFDFSLSNAIERMYESLRQVYTYTHEQIP